MKSKFDISNPMPPLWLRYPHISQYSMGWRMGYGEGYKWELSKWLETLNDQERAQYQELFPHPVFWRGYYNKDYNLKDIESYECGLVQFWRKNGEMKYTREKLTGLYNEDNNVDFIFFWKPGAGLIDKHCLGQWQHSVFQVDTDTYHCAEQYMMAEKARFFEDEETGHLIMESSDPKRIKALGKKVANFNQDLWDKIKYSIILTGNYYKFCQNKGMRDFLLSTGNKVLVEASPLDKIWGIGLSENNKKVLNPLTWKGSNLLGFALMEVRDEIRNVYRNYEKVEWSRFGEQK